MRTGSATRADASPSLTEPAGCASSSSSAAPSSASSISSSSTSIGSSPASSTRPGGRTAMAGFFAILVAGFMLTADLLCASLLGLSLVHELLQAAHGDFHRCGVATRLGGPDLLTQAALRAALAPTADGADAVGERALALRRGVRPLLEQAAREPVAHTAGQRLHDGHAVGLLAAGQRLRGPAPLGVLELGDDAARGHALGERRVLRHELDDGRLRAGRVRLLPRGIRRR